MATTQEQAREQLRRTAEGYMTDSIGAALEWLDSDDAAELIEAAGLAHLGTRRLLTELTGVSA